MPENVAAYAPPPMLAPELPEASAEKKDVPPGLFAQALQIPLRRWQVTAAILAISAAVGLGVGLIQQKSLYRVQGTLAYTTPPPKERLKPFYQPNKKDTYAKLILTTDNLQKVIDERGLDLSPTTLARLVKVESDPKSDSVTVSIEWEDTNEGTEIINRLLELHRQSVDRFQKNKVAAVRQLLDDQIRAKKSQLVEADNAFKAWRLASGIDNPVKEDERLAKTIPDLEKDKRTAEGLISRLELDIENHKREINAFKERERTDLARLKEEFANNAEYTAQLLTLKKNLNEAEGKLASALGELKAAQSDLNTELALERKNATSKEKVMQAREKVEAVQTVVNTQQQAVTLINQEIENLPRRLLAVKRGEVEKKLETDEKAMADEKNKIRAIDRRVRELRGEEGAHLRSIGEGRKLQERFTSLSAEIDDLVKNNEDLNILPPEVQIQEEASPLSAVDAGSNLKKKAIPPFAICFLVLMGLLVGSELKQMLGTTSNVAARMGLPVLSRYKLPDPQNRYAGNQAGAATAQSRGLALKIRQFLPENGGTVLFTALNPGAEVEDLINDVSRYLTLQDEQVLILDTRITEPQGQIGPPWLDPNALNEPTLSGTIETGLVQYLVFEGQKLNDKVTRTRMPKADYLPAGGPCLATDILASQQMRDLVPYLRRNYSVVLMVGPPLLQHIDLEILAGYVDGMVIVLNKPLDRGTDDAVAFVRNLKDLRAPLLGCVLCD